MPSAPDTATRESGWPKSRRVLRRADFRATYEQGMRRVSRHFTVFGRKRAGTASAGGAGARYGITASRKVGNAVQRNRIRRRTRELLRSLPEQSGGGCDFVINPRAAVARADFQELARELDEQVQRLGRRLQEPGVSGV